VGYTWLPGRFAILVDVEPYEVMQVLDGPARRWPRRVTGPRGLAMLAILGRTAAGRGLVVYVRHHQGLDWTIVGARATTAAELAAYDTWEAQQ
jgi:hypothetical protein